MSWTSKSGCHVNQNPLGFTTAVRLCESLVVVDRCVISVATDFKQPSFSRKEHLEGIYVYFCTNQHLFECYKALFIVYLHRVYDGLELWSEEPVHSQCLPSLWILDGQWMRMSAWRKDMHEVFSLSKCLCAILTDFSASKTIHMSVSFSDWFITCHILKKSSWI